MTMDWVFGKPFSIGWWHTDSDGRVYRAARWYGWNGTPDTGLRLEDSVIARNILSKEDEWGIKGKVTARYAGPDCFNKKPDYKGGGQGPSTAEIFASIGVHLSHGDPSRILKIRQFRERIKSQDEHGRPLVPMMLINLADDDFWRTVPNLVMDKNNIEDIDTAGEDHIFDEVAHIVMARPLGVKPKPTMLNMAQARIEAVERPQRNLTEDQIMLETMESQKFWDKQPDAGDMDRDRESPDWHYDDVG
jgi:hypothetical protein